MRVSVENDADREYRIVRKSDETEVRYVVEADTEAGFYRQFVFGEDGHPRLTHRVARIVVEGDKQTRYDENGDECGEEQWLTEEVREPFQIVHARTREVVAETV